MNEVTVTTNDPYYEQVAGSVTEIGDSVTIKMTKRGRSTKLVKNDRSVTRLECKNCDRFYMTQRKS